jgi:hypothetical protein
VVHLSETARHGTRKEENTNVYNVFVGKPKGKGQLGSPKLRQDDIKIYLK